MQRPIYLGAWLILGGGVVVCPAAAEPPPNPPAEVAAKRLPLTFEVLTRDAVLVTHCRTETVNGRLLGKVLATWRGEYAPALFEREPPDGYVDVRAGKGSGLEAGQEFVVFWNRLNQVGGKLRQFNIVPIRDGTLSLVIDRGRGREELTVVELKARVERARDGKLPPAT